MARATLPLDIYEYEITDRGAIYHINLRTEDNQGVEVIWSPNCNRAAVRINGIIKVWVQYVLEPKMALSLIVTAPFMSYRDLRALLFHCGELDGQFNVLASMGE